MNTVVKIVKPPIEPRLRERNVDFDEHDAEEWALCAIKHNAWQYYCTNGGGVGPTRITNPAETEAVVVIASPDGRVAVWYGRAIANRKGFSKDTSSTISNCGAALAATGDPAVAALWDGRRVRGGPRSVQPMATAACRVLHACVFGDPVSLRDQLLAEFAVLIGSKRPPTAHILKASDDALAAASALVGIKDYRNACAILAGRGAGARG